MSPRVALDVDRLDVDIHTPHAVLRAVDSVSFQAHRGRTVALLGESGCGKSMTATAIAGVLDPVAEVAGGSIRLSDAAGRITDLASASAKERRELAGAGFGLHGVLAPLPLRADRVLEPAGRARPVAAARLEAVVALAAFTPAGRAAAADFLASFRAERFQVVTFDPERPIDQAEDVEGLADIADVEVDGPRTGTTVVDSVAEASEVAGFVPAEATSLPDGGSLTAVHAAAPKTVRLRLRADRAPDLPAALDGAEVVVSVPGMVGSMYEVDGGTLVVGEAGQLTVDATGADLADIRAYLLGRPEVPQDLAAQLLAIDDWTTTVPIPIPVDPQMLSRHGPLDAIIVRDLPADAATYVSQSISSSRVRPTSRSRPSISFFDSVMGGTSLGAPHRLKAA